MSVAIVIDWGSLVRFIGMTALAATDSAILTSDWTLEIRECPTSNLRSWILVGTALRYGLWLAANKPLTEALRVLAALALTVWGFYEVYFGFCASITNSDIFVYVKVLTWAHAAGFAVALAYVLCVCLHRCCCPSLAQQLTDEARAAV